MLIEFPESPRYWTLPLTSNLKDAFRQVRADGLACRQSREPFRRRNALVISSSSILRTLLVAEAFKGAKLLMLDWKGRLFSREEADASILSPLSKVESSELPTVCIFDPDLMDLRQRQCVTYCMENSPITANFVLVTAAPTDVFQLIEKTAVVFDATEACVEDGYKAASTQFFNCVFKRETGFDLDKQDLEQLADEVAQQSPDMVAHLAIGLSYAQVEILADNQFRTVEGWLKPALRVALDRITKRERLPD